MRAAVYRGKGRVVVETVPVPVISDGEVLIRVAACGICGTDIKKIEHGFVAAPQIFGHEVSGTVVAVGAGVTKWKLGDRVMSFHHVPCGACFYCARRLYSQCPGYKKGGIDGGLRSQRRRVCAVVRAMPWVAERGMVAIPENISFDEATFIEPVNTCIKAVEKARVEAGETVLVMGLGPIGLLLMMLSKLARRDRHRQRSNAGAAREKRIAGRRCGSESASTACWRKKFAHAPAGAARTWCW